MDHPFHMHVLCLCMKYMHEKWVFHCSSAYSNKNQNVSLVIHPQLSGNYYISYNQWRTMWRRSATSYI